MNWKTIALATLTFAAIAGKLENLSAAAAESGANAYPLFPFCIDGHDAKKRTFDQQAVMLKELGYPGVGHLLLDKTAERITSLDAKDLKLFQISMTVDISSGKTPYDKRFTKVLPLLKGRGVQFCLLMNGGKPSDPAGDARAVEILRQMSDEARDSGADLLLYPHTGTWLESIEDCVRVADKVDRPNVNVMFNLCHWLRVSKDRDYARVLKLAMPRLHAVSICGADIAKKNAAWTEDYILPLDAGKFDLAAFLRTLKQLGYRGPIGLQCYGIGGDAREHLARSASAWQKLKKNLDD